MIDARDIRIEEWRPDDGDAARAAVQLGADLDALADVLHAVVYDAPA